MAKKGVKISVLDVYGLRRDPQKVPFLAIFRVFLALMGTPRVVFRPKKSLWQRQKEVHQKGI